MDQFFDDIAKVKAEYLLKATPFTKETTVNFSYHISEDQFFASLYYERTNSAENDTFDRKVDYELRDIENNYSKVDVLHISGYAGCGKTTYIHHLLRKNRHRIGAYDVIDYEGCRRAVEPFVERISSLIYKTGDITNLCNYFDLVANRQLYNVVRFQEQLEYLKQFSNILRGISLRQADTNEFAYHVSIEDFENKVGGEQKFLSFLLFTNLLLLLYQNTSATEMNTLILVIDNSDSLSNLYEEMILYPAIRQFANNCTYFYASNLQNDKMYSDNKVLNIFENTKLLLIFTTRVVTFKQYKILDPDWEKINGWTSLRLPEHYYDHKGILTHRIEYYINVCGETRTSVPEELTLLKSLISVAYRNDNFMRLFNGNVRSCVERLCNILSGYPRQVINELISLYHYSLANPEAVEGTNGYFLNLVLNIFKNEHIYDDKLNLSSCRKDGKLSLSRIILTILRENENSCSLFKLFQSLVPLGIRTADICLTIWNLSERGRDVWRRLLIFDHIVPNSLDSLQRQGLNFDSGITDLEEYSEIVICTAGLAYMEFVVPHFEFMFTRHELEIDAHRSIRYQALFSNGSEQNISNNPEKVVYRFEKKIDDVFCDVRDCCFNSTAFARRVMEAFQLTRNEYIRSTAFNYHTVGWDGEIGPKQSYESRLVFRHIGYIEKYRRYLLKKHENMETEYLADINRRLVERIVKYIKLYQDSTLCFQTELQDNAAIKLLELAQSIQQSRYTDFQTVIELPN